MRILILVLTFFCIPYIGNSQVQVYDSGRQYNDTLPDRLKLNVSEIRDNIYNGVPESFKNKESRMRSAFRFSDQAAYSITEQLKSGEVYTDWPAFEKYINDIFEKVIPEDFPDRDKVHIYLFKNGGFNAFMTPSGVSCAFIGMFADVKDEAALAGVLAHELAHYVEKHSIERFVAAEQGEFKKGKRKAISQFSIANEAQADSLAMIWMEQSGYSLEGMYRSFSVMKNMQDRAIMRMEDKWEFEATSHPLPASRLENLRNYKGESKGADFLVSEKLFKEFREKAKPEILKHLLEDFGYDACIEQAFKFHIEDTNNPVYLYYLMESIRRKCYLNPEKWSKNFITDNYYEVVIDTEEERKKKKMEASLFEKYPEDILSMTEKELKESSGSFYWGDEVKFKTYEQAFDFFFRVSQLFDYPECVLSNALSITKADDIRAKALEKYLSYKDIRYRDYAESLLNNKITESLKKEKMIVWSVFQAIVRQGKEDVLIRHENPDDINSLSLIFDTIMTDYPDRKAVFLPDWGNYRLNDYQMLLEMNQFSRMTTISKGQRTELHILDPRYWEALRKFDVNEVQFINCYYYESRKAEKTLDAYKELISKDFLDIFNETKRTKYLAIYVTSLRSVENGAMKIKFFGGDNKLKFKKNSRSQIISIVKKRIEEMEMEAKKTDRRFRKN